jgi:hypothetical protein
MSPALLLWGMRLAAIAAVAGAIGWALSAFAGHYETVGQLRERAAWQARQAQADQAAARETLRRLDRQGELDRETKRQLDEARTAAARNRADADRLREQSAGAARQWAGRLADSPSAAECTAAGDAIGVLADVLGRADRRAGQLADYADAAHTAGASCEARYDALTGGKP